jgi:ubiquinone biosynthesis protein UbiJ
MDGVIDIRLLITLGGILFSVAGAAAVGKMQISNILDSLSDIERRLRDIDKRIDGLETSTETQEQRLKVLAAMSSPENMRRDHMQIADVLANVRFLRDEVERLRKIHNGSHPPVASERRGA